MNRALPSDIHLQAMQEVKATFNVRGTQMKEYVYFINCSNDYSV